MNSDPVIEADNVHCRRASDGPRRQRASERMSSIPSNGFELELSGGGWSDKRSSPGSRLTLRGTNAKPVTSDSLSYGLGVSLPREVQIGFDIGKTRAASARRRVGSCFLEGSRHRTHSVVLDRRRDRLATGAPSDLR